MRSRVLIYIALGALAGVLVAVSLLDVRGPQAADSGPDIPTPARSEPVVWINCFECKQAGEQVTLWDSPEKNLVVDQLPHATYVWLLGEEKGPDGVTYYHIEWRDFNGWVEEQFISNRPPAR